MYYKVRKLQAARQRMKEQLLALGWKERECRYKATNEFDINVALMTPHIDSMWLEAYLKEINTGEAYYALEMRCYDLIHLAWRCNDDNPHNHDVLDTLEAFDMARRLMLDGIDFDYYRGKRHPKNVDPSKYSGHISIIDWEHPERNTFDFVQGWHGGLNDGFGWDFVLCVNAIPVGAIILEADDDALPPCQKALDVAQRHLDADYQFPVYCHALFLSDGKQLLAGAPWMELDQFTPIDSPLDALRPVEFLRSRVENIED